MRPAAALARDYAEQSACEAPAHVLFPQIAKIVDRFVRERVRPPPPAEAVDAFLSSYYGWIIERLVSASGPTLPKAKHPSFRAARAIASPAQRQKSTSIPAETSDPSSTATSTMSSPTRSDGSSRPPTT